MNHPTETFGATPRTGAEEPPPFRTSPRQLPGQQAAGEQDRTLGLRNELAQQALLTGGAESQRQSRDGVEQHSVHDLPPLVEPVYDPNGLDFTVEALGDHPLLRGLLMELPPRGGHPPNAEWLDRWFEATRSILELLYSQGSYKIGV